MISGLELLPHRSDVVPEQLSCLANVGVTNPNLVTHVAVNFQRSHRAKEQHVCVNQKRRHR